MTMTMSKKLSKTEFNSLMSDILSGYPIDDLLDKYKIKFKSLYSIIYGHRYKKWWVARKLSVREKIKEIVDRHNFQHESDSPKPTGIKKKRIILSYECEYIEAPDDDEEKIKQEIEANGLDSLIKFANNHYSKAINAWIVIE